MENETGAWRFGSERIPAFVRNTQLFDLMLDMAGVQEFAESFQQLRKELLPYGEAQRWLTDEDVFREVS